MKRGIARLIAVFLAGALIVGLSTFMIQQQTEELLETPLPKAIKFNIPSGATLSEIADITYNAGVPINKTQFIAIAKYLKVEKALKAGQYHFASGKKVKEIIQAIADGKVTTEKFSIIEGTTFADLRTRLGGDNRFTHPLKNMDEATLKSEITDSYEKLEGLFLPETYFFDSNTADIDILHRAHTLLEETLADAWQNRNPDIPIKTPYEALILASIVEKETGVAEERKLIASVFTNRLRKGMRLQADPTVIYGLGEDFKGNITRAHLRQDTPYNTYTRHGLPPTPIDNRLICWPKEKNAVNPTRNNWDHRCVRK